MTPYNVAKRVELDAAQAMQEAWVARDMEKYRLATEWHLRCLAHRIVAELQERRRAS
jgi:hypothetical protein